MTSRLQTDQPPTTSPSAPPPLQPMGTALSQTPPPGLSRGAAERRCPGRAGDVFASLGPLQPPERARRPRTARGSTAGAARAPPAAAAVPAPTAQPPPGGRGCSGRGGGGSDGRREGANSFRGRGGKARFRFQPLPSQPSQRHHRPPLPGLPLGSSSFPGRGFRARGGAAPGGGAREPSSRYRSRRRHRCGTVSVSSAPQHGSSGKPRSSQAGAGDASRQRGPHRVSLRPAAGAGGSGRESAQLRQHQLPRFP